jgi:hypothetical protein
MVLLTNTMVNQGRLMIRCSNQIFFDLNNRNFFVKFTPVVVPPLAMTNQLTHTSCGVNNGAINIAPTGGTTPYTYLWSNSATTEDLSGLAAGTYTLTLSEQGGMTLTSSFVINGSSAPDISTIDIYDNSGIAGDGKACTNFPINFGAFLTPATGTPTYTWQWSENSSKANMTGAGNTAFEGVITDNTSNAPVTVSVKAIVTDQLGCKDSMTVQIIAQSNISIDTIYRMDNSGSPNDGGVCFGDSISFFPEISPVGTYNYLWDNGLATQTIRVQPIFNLSNTVYYLTVTDQAGCSVSTFTSAKGIPELIVNPTYVDACPATNSDTLTLNVSGGGVFPGNEYLFLVNGNTIGTFSGSPLVLPFLEMVGDTFSVEIRDEKGCKDSIQQIVPVGACGLTCSTSTTLFCPGETFTLTADPLANTQIQWHKDGVPIPGATSNTYLVTSAGAYTYTALNNTGCDVAGCCPAIFIPNGNCPSACPPKVCLPVSIVRN